MSKKQKTTLAMLCRMAAWAAIFAILIGMPTILARSASTAETVYIRLIGGKSAIEGSSKDSAHAGWISGSSVVAGDLNGDSMSDREIGSATSGAGSGKATAASKPGAGKSVTGHDVATGQASGKRMHKPFVILREIDKTSPLLMKACASGELFSAAEVDLVERGRTVHYKMSDVIISSVSSVNKASRGGDRPMESVSFTYEKIEMTK
jgi:type VI protein secretion system component Hcp